MQHQRTPAWLIAIYACAALFVAIAIGPGLFLLAGALQGPAATLGTLEGPYTTDNFAGAWRDGRLGVPLLNSVIVTLARAGLNVLLAALAAYPLARMRFRGRNAIFLFILATTMIPEQVIVVPMFKIAAGMGFYDSLAGVVIPFSVSAFGIFLCRQAFLSIPDAMEEAARMDGATSIRIWWSVMLPLITPTLATLTLFSIIGAWSDLLWPLIILQSDETFTLPVAINQMLGVFSTNPRIAYAASVLALVPIIVFFIAMKRWLTPELFQGAVKG